MRGRLTYANVMATLALFVALTGGAYAAGLIDIPRNSITSLMLAQQSVRSGDLQNNGIKGQDVKPETLTAQQIKPGVLTGEEVANGSLTGDDVAGSTLGGVNAETVDGRSLNCPAGTTFYVWGCWELNTNAPANWTGAAVGCGVKGGVLPGVAELAAFADQTPGVIITTPEWTSEMSDGGGANALQGIKFNEPTVVNYSPFTDNNPFRCVLPIIN